MSGCWAFSNGALARSWTLAVLLGLALAPAAEARRWCPFASTASAHRHRRITFGDNGIIIRRAPDAANDSDSSVVTVGGDFDAGPIVVHGNGSGNGIVRLFSDARIGPGERVDGDVVA